MFIFCEVPLEKSLGQETFATSLVMSFVNVYDAK